MPRALRPGSLFGRPVGSELPHRWRAADPWRAPERERWRGTASTTAPASTRSRLPPTAGYTFPDGETVKSVTFTVAGKLASQSQNPTAPCYLAPPEDPELVPGAIASQCVGSVPYLATPSADRGLRGPSSTPLTITFVHPTDPAQNYAVSNLPLEGTLLWPGASAAPRSSGPAGSCSRTAPTSRPRQLRVDARRGARAFDVNPTTSTTVSLPGRVGRCARTRARTRRRPPCRRPVAWTCALGHRRAAMLIAGAALLI